MKIKKMGIISEVIDSNGELIGNDDTPHSGADLESQANGTTDYNVSIGTQPYRYDMMARFGFNLLPFMEESKNSSEQNTVINNMVDIIKKEKIKQLEIYYRNPNKIKNDFRKFSNNDDSVLNDESKILAGKLLKFVGDNLKIKSSIKIDEAKLTEDKFVKISDDEFAKKKDNDINDKKFEKVLDLILKLDDNEIDKLIKILENNNG